MARLIELCVLGMNVAILIAAILVGVNVSIWLGVALLIVASLSVFYLIFNFDYWFVRQLTKIEPQLLMQLCETGAIGRARRLMRKLPSNPRCKFCQVPIVRWWPGIIGRMPDNIPVVGPSKNAIDAYHAFGFSGHGFQLGPIIGQILSELILDGRSSIPIDSFLIDRFTKDKQ